MRGLSILVAVLMIAIAVAIEARTAWSPGGETPRAEADRYSQVVGLSDPLGAQSPEVRVWHYDYLSGFVTGYVVTSHAVTVYEFSTNPDAPVVRRVRRVPTLAAPDVVRQARDLRRYNRQNWFCPMMDGGRLVVDVFDEHRATLAAANPDACDDQRSRAIVALSASISSIDGVLPPPE